MSGEQDIVVNVGGGGVVPVEVLEGEDVAANGRDGGSGGGGGGDGAGDGEAPPAVGQAAVEDAAGAVEPMAVDEDGDAAAASAAEPAPEPPVKVEAAEPEGADAMDTTEDAPAAAAAADNAEAPAEAPPSGTAAAVAAVADAPPAIVKAEEGMARAVTALEAAGAGEDAARTEAQQTQQQQQLLANMQMKMMPENMMMGYPAGAPAAPPGVIHTPVAEQNYTVVQTPVNPQQAYRPLKVEDALAYLDQVKIQFGNQPMVYNRFLDIMKDFKMQNIDTPGVIQRVTSLFRGHRSLILGFNTFLPPGYKIEMDEQQSRTMPVPAPAMAAHQMPAAAAPVAPAAPVAAAAPAMPPPVGGALAPGLSGAAGAAGSRKPPIEYDHAINYVTKIKTRFADQPEIYKAFLDILHTYQREQRSIQEVYAQVAELFESHYDLLHEFKQFLPHTGPAAGHVPMPGPAVPQRKARGNKTRVPKKGAGAGVYQAHQYDIVRENVEKKEPAKERRGKKRTNAAANAGAGGGAGGGLAALPVMPAPGRAVGRDDVYEPPVPRGFGTQTREALFFERVRDQINNRVLYDEFLKCLHLFSQDIITRGELLALVQDILGSYPELFTWFQNFLAFDDDAETRRERLQTPKASVDYSTLKRCGPSYRLLPETHVQPSCSGRTELCYSVLNDTMVSVPTGSEDFGFKYARKNQYEEALFRCEDERYELDMQIQIAESTLRVMQPMVDEVAALSADDASQYRLAETVSAVHLKGIERMYGSRGPEVVEGLRKNPVIAIPIIVRRIEQKISEWQAAQKELNKVWADVHDKNVHKALDHQSFQFKLNDRKLLNTKSLLSEAKVRQQECTKGQDLYVFEYSDKTVLRDCEDILRAVLADVVSDEQADRAARLWQDLFGELLMYRSSDAAAAPAASDDGGRYKPMTVASGSAPFALASTRAEAEKQQQEAPKENGNGNGAGAADGPQDMDLSKDEGKVAPTIAQAAAAAAVGVANGERKLSHLFFSNSTLFVFFRLHVLFYERVLRAKELSRSYVEKPESVRPIQVRMSGSQVSPITVAQDRQDPEHLYRLFLEALHQMLSNEIDMNKFEDECRLLFGMNAYMLFTMDKLIAVMAKQVQNIVACETSNKLLALYTYERSRTSGMDASVYLSNALSLLGEDQCFRFERFADVAGDRCELAVRLLDVDNHKTVISEINSLEKRWSRYIERYMQSEGEDLDLRKHRILLQRNLRKNKSEDAVMENLTLVNGLECKISMGSYKLFYVEGSEDFMYRPRPNGRARTATDARRKKMENWLQEKGL